MVIGICDDNLSDIVVMRKLCESYLFTHQVEGKFKEFSGGLAVLDYCRITENEKIDLLFLDVEMPDLNGIDVKEMIKKNNLVYRLAFVTSHRESIYCSFSLKTVGFINKPASQKDVSKMLQIVLEEMKENVVIDYPGYCGERIQISADQILYFEADESYTKVCTYEQMCKNKECTIISRKLGQVEKEIKEYGFIRVHKSFLVNLANISDVGEMLSLRGCNTRIPIGRKFRVQVQENFLLYGREKLRRRL